LTEWLAASGDVAQQVSELPDGTPVRLDLTVAANEAHRAGARCAGSPLSTAGRYFAAKQ